MALWYYGWEFTQTDPTFPSYVLSSVQWIHPFLSRLISENKLLASVPCFQKICLLFTNDLYFLTITCRPSRSFILFFFLFYMFINTIHLWFFMRKTFLCTSTFLYMTNFFCTRIRTLSLYVTRSIYKPYLRSKIFLFFPTHTYGSHKSFFIYTRCSHTQGFLSTHHLHTQKNLLYTLSFFFVYTDILFTTLLFLFFSFYFWFILFFRTTFLNEKFYAIPEF